MTSMDKLEMSQTNTFDTMNLIGLRKYACCTADKRKNEWYLECVGCEKKTCAVGKRVNDILEDGTKPIKSQVQKFEDREKKHWIAERTKLIEESLRYDDPYQWLADQGIYKNKESAYACAREFCMRYAPDVRKRLNNIGKTRISNTQILNANKQRDDTIEHIRNLFENTAEDERPFIAIQDSDPKYKFMSLVGRMYNWARNYPDLNNRYDLFGVAGKLLQYDKKYGSKHTVGEILDILKEEKAMVTVNCAEPGKKDDEMSLEEFLSEAPEVKEPPKTEPVLKVETKGPEKAATDAPMEVLRIQFGQKKVDLMAKKQMLENTIKKAQEALKDLDMQIKTLDDAALIFGMVPKTDKEVV